MLVEPPIYKICEHCSGIIEQFSLMSGNTFGATYWTDGKCDAPMLPDFPEYVKCPHCRGLLWINDQEELLDDKGESLKAFSLDGAKGCRNPTFYDLLNGANQMGLDKNKQIYLRIRAWWKGNDKRRKDNEVDQPLKSKEVDNLKALFTILDEGNLHDRILKAEIYRELGLYEEAKEMLKGEFSEDVAQAVSLINELSSKGDCVVRQIVFD